MYKEPSIPLPLAKFAHTILASEKPYFKIIPTSSNKKIPPTQSNFLGQPYWSTSINNYPRNVDGKPLRMIAQINFADFNKDGNFLEDFPKTGILQFFIPDFYELHNYNPLNESVVVYHETIDLPNLSSKEIYKINSINIEVFSGYQNCLLTFEKKYKFCSLIDKYYSQYFYSEFIEMLSKEEINQFCNSEEFDPTGCKIGGYACFYQEHLVPKLLKEPFNEDNPWILLFQIDNSINNFSKKDNELYGYWGANWFIRKDDLLSKNFSKTILNCHKF